MALVAVAATLVACGSTDGSGRGTTATARPAAGPPGGASAAPPTAALRRLSPADVPEAVRSEAASMPEGFGDRSAAVAVYRGRASAVGRAVGPLIVRGDPDVVLLTARGRLRLRRGHRPKGSEPYATGPFGYRIVDPTGRVSLGVGLMKRPPALP